MKVRRLRRFPFSIPYRNAFVTARGAAAHREGVIVLIEADAGLTGIGEASPYPGAGEREARRAVERALGELARTLEGCPLDDALPALDRALAETSPRVAKTVRAGVDIALWDVRARSAGVPVAALLCDEPRDAVPVNALIADPSIDGACAAARQARIDGFQTAKLKVGAAASTEEERARIVAVLDALGPGVSLRLDANGAWDARRATAVLEGVEARRIEYVEQPVPPGDLDAMRAVREHTGVPVAADEAVTDAGAAQRLLDARAADILVLKPLLLGGLGPALAIARLAEASGAGVVVTTTVDAGAGVAAAWHLASALPPRPHADGLATGALLESDLLVRPPEIQRGVMRLPEGSGLGVALDRAALDRYAARFQEAPA